MTQTVIQTTIRLVLAIAAGIATGLVAPNSSPVSWLDSNLDYLVLALVFLVFVDAPIDKVAQAIRQPKVLAIAWITNFAIIPLLGVAIARLVLPNHPIAAIGIAIYTLAPCTDWYLGFTRMAGGNTALGSVLVPINMVTQLALYPFYIQLVTSDTQASVSAGDLSEMLIGWFLKPVALAIIIRIASKYAGGTWATIPSKLGELTDWVIAALTFAIFAANVAEIKANISILGPALLALAVFFVAVSAITEFVSKRFRLEHGDHALYSITTTARNAPLMLGLSTKALPDQPLVYAAIVIGMLLEFPLLVAHVARFKAKAAKAKNTTDRTGVTPSNSAAILSAVNSKETPTPAENETLQNLN